MSVGIVAYNHEKFLGALVDSVLAQDYPFVTLFIADDASTDGTAQLCQKYALEYPDRVRYSVAKHNAGVTANSNMALRGCDGDFICLVGGDDVFLPGKISSQVAWLLAHPDAALCGCGVEVFDSATNEVITVVRDRVLRAQGGVGAMLRQSCATPTSAFMFRRALIGDIRFEENTPIVSDWLYIIEACMRGGYGCVDQVLLRYRRHVDNVTGYGASKSHFGDRLASTDMFLTRYRVHYLSIRIQRGKIFYEHGKRCAYDRNQREAAKFMLYSIAEWPLNLRPWLGLWLCLLSSSGVNVWPIVRAAVHKLRGIRRTSLAPIE